MTRNAGAAEHTIGLCSQDPVSHKAVLHVSACLLNVQFEPLETFLPEAQSAPCALTPSGTARALKAHVFGVQLELLHPEVESHVVLVHS